MLLLRGKAQADWPGVISALHNADLDSPQRSTIPLVAYWRDLDVRYRHLGNQLALPATTPVTYSFEYPVEDVRGRGKPSCTDLMILAPSVAVAIEGKYTEPQYEKVDDWLHHPRDPNRAKVLRGWLDLVEAATETRPTLRRVLQLPYQLIHRVASACFPPATHRAVVYQIFDNHLRDDYLEHLRTIRTLVPAPVLKLAILETPAQPSAAYSDLLTRWKQGQRKMAYEVRSALMGGPAFTFAESSVHIV